MPSTLTLLEHLKLNTHLFQAKHFSTAWKCAGLSSSQLYHSEHFSASTPHMFVIFSWLSAALRICHCLLVTSRWIVLPVPKEKDTIWLPHCCRARQGPLPEPPAQIPGGFREWLLKFLADAKCLGNTTGLKTETRLGKSFHLSGSQLH